MSIYYGICISIVSDRGWEIPISYIKSLRSSRKLAIEQIHLFARSLDRSVFIGVIADLLFERRHWNLLKRSMGEEKFDLQQMVRVSRAIGESVRRVVIPRRERERGMRLSLFVGSENRAVPNGTSSARVSARPPLTAVKERCFGTLIDYVILDERENCGRAANLADKCTPSPVPFSLYRRRGF